MKCLTSSLSGYSAWSCTNRTLHGWEEGSLSGCSSKQNVLQYYTKAPAFVWPTAHLSPKLYSNSQGVSMFWQHTGCDIDNASISSWKFSKRTKVFLLFVYSLRKQGGCLPINMIVCLQSCACKVSMQHTKSLSAEHYCSITTGKTFLKVTYFSNYFVSVLIKQNIEG